MPLNVTLASSLLGLEIDQHRQANGYGGRTFKTGITTLDKDLPESLWRGGDVVAIGTDGAGVKPGSLPLEVIVTHLLAQHTHSEPNPKKDQIAPISTSTSNPIPSVYIIAPPYQATSTIQRLYTMLKTRLSQSTESTLPTQKQHDLESTIKSYLSHISLLQYLDISGLAESISEVLAAITDSQSPKDRTSQPHRSTLLLQGLNSTVTSTYRRNGTLQTAAVLSSIMQGLRNIARTSLRGGGSCLVLLESDIVWDGGAGAGDERTRQQNQNHSPGVGGSGGAAANAVTATSGLKSAFSSRTGKILRININNVFARIIEDGIDVFVAVHDGEGRIEKGGKERMVECVRDDRGFVDLRDLVGIGAGSAGGEEDGSSDSRSRREVNCFGSWAVWT